MRKDMGKVLCEEPRRGMRVKDRKGRKRSEARIPLDEQPHKEKGCLRRKWLSGWGDNKNFGDHVQPLRRFILSCVGRKWDDVYSEIRRTVPKGTVVNNHLYTHLFQYIATNVYIINGIPYNGDYSSWRSRTGMPVYQDTYVHPDTGIICRTPKIRRNRRTTPRKFVRKDEYTVYCKDSKNIWWECSLIELPPDKQTKRYFMDGKTYMYVYEHGEGYDVFLKKPVTTGHDLKVQYGSANKYCIRKRQLNKDEIRKCKLNQMSN